MAKPLFSNSLLDGSFDWINDDYSLIMMDDTYSGFNSDTYLSEVSGQQGVIAPITGKDLYETGNGLVAIGDNEVSFGVISAGVQLYSVIVIRDTGDPATSYLCLEITRFSVNGMPYDTVGAEVTLEFPLEAGAPGGKSGYLGFGS